MAELHRGAGGQGEGHRDEHRGEARRRSGLRSLVPHRGRRHLPDVRPPAERPQGDAQQHVGILPHDPLRPHHLGLLVLRLLRGRDEGQPEAPQDARAHAAVDLHPGLRPHQVHEAVHEDHLHGQDDHALRLHALPQHDHGRLHHPHGPLPPLLRGVGLLEGQLPARAEKACLRSGDRVLDRPQVLQPEDHPQAENSGLHPPSAADHDKPPAVGRADPQRGGQGAGLRRG
mmetsp:Transcript_77411/g.167417  ORF Transcript_77411/g.167417 Transcript_77411/m.167417 type:complete len:229 (-) Transcript_77411:40-726(-)